jgi:Methyltransferase domain
MTQNIYDNERFFAGYSSLPRSVEGLDCAPEWPALRAMLPDVSGCRAVDLGCGFGWFCRWARQNGAASVLGLDISEKMLNRARAETDDPAIAYQRADLERLDLPEASFDPAYSSLALHYLENLEGMLQVVHCALAPGGWLVFSAEHPMMTRGLCRPPAGRQRSSMSTAERRRSPAAGMDPRGMAGYYRARLLGNTPTGGGYPWTWSTSAGRNCSAEPAAPTPCCLPCKAAPATAATPLPVTSEARSEARNATGSPSSIGIPSRYTWHRGSYCLGLQEASTPTLPPMSFPARWMMCSP